MHPAPRAGLLPAPAVPAGPVRPALPRRRRLWDLGDSLHCSIVGTCLSTDELRRLLRKLGLGAAGATDHALHSMAVGLAGRQDAASKLLNKALDERHRAVIRRFNDARDTASLRDHWRAAMAAGDIPGAYWAVLTHPVTDQALISAVFGEVHMLSHLVGAANRADIRRLADQEREIAALRETVARQQARLQADITERDGRIRTLQELIARQAGQRAEAAPGRVAEVDRLVGDLHGRLQREIARREAAKTRELAARAAQRQEHVARLKLVDEVASLTQEVAAAEAAMVQPDVAPSRPSPFGTVLYVGGRSGQTALLRRAAAAQGAALLHFDAEQGSATLPGLVGRADLVVFPVDCVSHDAALGVKRLCRQLGRPFQPLRSTGAASLLAALRQGPSPPA
ncbi:DUF2325 domain-containing protein [Humitalea sp. 24SJ18S-53]|uniref:DUF2325 domain-containing protein n=1 Tax=Humitalea sp. 24SJ18S-53 TaxID=3422307 RepID=UPI003D669347